MPAGYRDSLEGLRAQIDALRGDVEPLESRLLEVPWSAVAPAWGIAPYARMPSAEGLDFDGLGALFQAAEARLRALRAFFTELPDERAGWTTPPPNAPALAVRAGADRTFGYVYAVGSAYRDAVGEWVRDLIRALEKLAPGAEVVPLEGSNYSPGWGAHLARGGVPLTAVLRAVFNQDDRGVQPVLEFRTSVALAAGPVHIVPQGMGDELLKLVGLRRDFEFDEPDFDGMFFVRGDEPAARAALTPEVRRALLTVAREDVPSVEVDRGLATVRWSYPPTLASMTAAADALVDIRAAPVVWPRAEAKRGR